MSDILASTEAERDGALDLLKTRTAFLIYLTNEMCKEPCLGCQRAVDKILEHFSNPNI